MTGSSSTPPAWRSRTLRREEIDVRSPLPHDLELALGPRPEDGVSRRRRLPPRWFIRAFWVGHRFVYRVTGGGSGCGAPATRAGARCASPRAAGAPGATRVAIIAYLEDGPDLTALAMNGWADPEPAWWLNLQAHPDTTVVLPGGPRAVHARAATGEERERLWARWAEVTRASTTTPPAAAADRGRRPEPRPGP